MKLGRWTLATLLGLIGAASQAQAGDQDFILVNKTGIEIHALYVSPADKDDWGEDVLGEDTLPNGEELEITFSRKEKAALWDVRIEDEDGGSIEWEKLNLLEISKVTLNFNKKTKKASASVEKAEAAAPARPAAQNFVVVNKTGVEIHALYVSAADKEKWGDDVLGRDTLPDGAEVTIKFSPREKAALWDLRVEDEDGGSIEWEELNLLEISKVTLIYNKKTSKATARVE